MLVLSPSSGAVAPLKPPIIGPHGAGNMPGAHVAIAVCLVYIYVSLDIKELRK